MSKGHGLLVVAAILLALVVTVALWATSTHETPPPAPPEAPAQGMVPVTGSVGLESAEGEGARAPPLEAAERTAGGTPDAPTTPAPAPSTSTAGLISGVVMRRSGGPAAEGTWVVARASPNPRSDADLAERILRGAPDLPVARSARDGSFAIGHLVPGSNYYLSAYGDACVSVEPAVPASAGSTDIRVEVCLLYGLALELREDGGRPLRSSIEVFDVNQSRTATSTPFPDSPFLSLLAVDLAPYRASSDRANSDRRLLLFTSSRLEEPPSLDKIPVRLRIAGYAPVQAAFDAQPVLPALTVHRLELRPSAAGFGEILLQFSDGEDPTPDAPKSKRWRVQLSSTTGIQGEIEIPRERGLKRIAGVPYGRYRIAVVNCLDQEVYPARAEGPSKPVEIGESPLRLDVSLAETSTLEIAIEPSGPARGASLYQGPATFSLARGEPTADRRSVVGPTATVTFERGPYVLGGLRAGKYMLFVQEPAGAAPDPASGPPGILDLAAGQREHARLLAP